MARALAVWLLAWQAFVLAVAPVHIHELVVELPLQFLELHLPCSRQQSEGRSFVHVFTRG
jgi:hypothetical protein